MDLDSFLISILFDNNKTNESARKIENIVLGLTTKIIGAFSAIASFDFLKNAVESSINLTTKLDNLSYATNISKENLNAWGEAVKRNGGTTEGFYSSVSSLASKIREMQTNFGTAGQLVFARLGLSIKDANGNVRDALDILGDLGDKFRDLPKVWQLNLGQQLGLDQATIRLISSGSESASKLVQHMKDLAQLNNVNTERNIKLRNSLYDISLVFDGIKLRLANDLIPLTKSFADILLKALVFLQEHFAIVRIGILILAGLMAGLLVRSIAAVTRAVGLLTLALLRNPFTWIIIAILGFALVLDDFLGYLEGKKSALESFYNTLGGTWVIKGIKLITTAVKDFADELLRLNKITSNFFGFSQLGDINEKIKENVINNHLQNNPSQTIKDKIKKAASYFGLDPNTVGTIANIESGFNPNARSSTSSASGIFQLTNETATSNGLSLKNKNNINDNIAAGVLNIKKITDGLTNFFGHIPSGSQTYIGERFGLEGAKRIFSASGNTLISQLFGPSVLRANPQFRNMTTGQLINNANKTFQQKSVTIGDVNINAPNANAGDISRRLGGLMQQHFSNLVTNIDNGVRA